MAYRTLKPISLGDGTTIPIGTMVDASKWRNLRALVGGRYLVEVADAIVQEDESRPAPKGGKRVKQIQG